MCLLLLTVLYHIFLDFHACYAHRTCAIARVALHVWHCSIKVLPDQRGFVCAGDDSVISAVATLEVSSEEDIRRAAFALSGHSGFVTDCDTADCGHAILSSR